MKFMIQPTCVPHSASCESQTSNEWNSCSWCGAAARQNLLTPSRRCFFAWKFQAFHFLGNTKNRRVKVEKYIFLNHFHDVVVWEVQNICELRNFRWIHSNTCSICSTSQSCRKKLCFVVFPSTWTEIESVKSQVGVGKIWKFWIFLIWKMFFQWLLCATCDLLKMFV